jgi:hypothetical protein
LIYDIVQRKKAFKNYKELFLKHQVVKLDAYSPEIRFEFMGSTYAKD